MATISLTIELEFDNDIYPAYSDDDSERDWFRNHLLRDDLILHSNLVGDEVGKVRLLSINEGEEPDWRDDKVAWIKWYRKVHGCDLKTAVEAGRKLFA